MDPRDVTEALNSLGQLGHVFRCPGRVRFCQQGNPPDQIYLLEAGLATVSVVDEYGGEYYIHYRTPGWILGAACAITGKPYPAHLAAQVASSVRVIQTPDFLRLLKENLRFSGYVHNLHCYELYEQLSKLSSLALCSTRERLEEFLWEILPHIPSTNGRLQLPFSDVEIARFIATTPQHLSLVWKQLEGKGLVRRSRGWLLVEYPERLWHRPSSELVRPCLKEPVL